jgi:hypothetical protein
VGERPKRLCIGSRAFLHAGVPALLPATYGPAPSVAKAPASIRLEGPDAGVAPALLAALCRARVVSGNVLVGEGKQDCGDFRDRASVGVGMLSLYA